MKTIKANLAVIALILGTLAAFATKAPNTIDKPQLIYGYDESVTSGNPWVEASALGYSCVSSMESCKYSFDSPPDENTLRSEATPSGSELGSFQQIE